MALRLPEVETLLAVKAAGSLSIAARRLGVTTSQVSKALTRLEGELGVRLIERTPRGARLLDGTEALLTELADVVSRIDALTARARGERVMTIAGPSWLQAALLPALAAASQGSLLQAIELPPTFLAGYGGARTVHLGLTLAGVAVPPGWQARTIGTTRRGVFAAPATAKRLGAQPISAETASSRRWVRPLYALGDQLVPLEDGCPLPPTQRLRGHEVPRIGTALEVAAATDQLVFGPELAARALVARGQLVEVRVLGWDVREQVVLARNPALVTVEEHQVLATSLARAL